MPQAAFNLLPVLKEYSTRTFQQLLSSSEGLKMFTRGNGVVPTTVTIGGHVGCQDKTGCVCGNHGLVSSLCNTFEEI